MIRLLIVDDELMEREALTDIVMRRFEHEVTVETAENGRKGADTAVLWGADLILMDIQMPVMNGYEAAKQIRSLKNRETASVPIVAMTANAFEEDREKSYEAGMNGYLAKPVSAEALINTIDKIMKDN